MTFQSSIVSVEWLNAHKNGADLIILDATIPKVGSSVNEIPRKFHIPNSQFFDLKTKFSSQEANFPNTAPSIEQFQHAAQALGINSNSQIVIYDDLGIYSGPRAWWLFKLMGFDNVAVLDGGFPTWKLANFPLERRDITTWNQGNFESAYRPDFITSFETIQSNFNQKSFKIIDARPKKRFEGLESEPRKGLRSGTIPNSINLPYTEVIEANSILNASRLQSIFNNFVKPDNTVVFSCGSGVTACILALAADIAGYKNFSVYDGSWTEYGSLVKT